MKICAIIPAYNEAKNIRELVEKTSQFIKPVVVIDDGSADDTTALAQKAGAVVVTHPVNKGKGEALNTAYRWVIENGFDAFFTLDGDLQHEPSEMPGFIKCMKKTHAHIVLGNRMGHTSEMPFERLATNILTSMLVNFAGGLSIHDSQVGYRLIKTEVVKTLRVSSTKYDHETEILIRAGRRGLIVKEVPISTIYLGGPSKIHPVKDSIRFLKLLGRFYL